MLCPSASSTSPSGVHQPSVSHDASRRRRRRAGSSTGSRACWVAVRHADEDLPGSGSHPGRLPLQVLWHMTASRMACFARQLVTCTAGACRKVNRCSRSRARWSSRRRLGAGSGWPGHEPVDLCHQGFLPAAVRRVGRRDRLRFRHSSHWGGSGAGATGRPVRRAGRGGAQPGPGRAGPVPTDLCNVQGHADCTTATVLCRSPKGRREVRAAPRALVVRLR
jgi:hypothetical protein